MSISIAEVTRRRAAIAAWRQRGFVAAKVGTARLSDERLLELGGEDGRRAYVEGIRTGERERRRAEERQPTMEGAS